MKNEEISVSEELEQLRQQYSELKAQIDKQEITNEKLIRESIRKDLRIVNGKVWLSIVCGSFAIPLVIFMSLELGLWTPFMVVSVVWIAAMILGNIIRNRSMAVDLLSGESAQRFLAEIKKRKSIQFRWLRINFTLFVFWISYFIGECIHAGLSREMLIPLSGGVLIGAVIGIVMGLRVHNRIIGTYEGIILELENPDAAHSIMK